MKKLLVVLCTVALFAGCSANKPAEAAAPAAVQESAKKVLPPPVDSTNAAAMEKPFAAASSSINATNLYEYFGRDDVFYIDLRDYVDYQKKHLRNFECIPYFAYVFNADAGKDPSKTQLYGGSVTAPVAAYKESDDMLGVLFPKDKTLFIMCQSGGRVAQLLSILSAKGYDMSKIYNVGGMGQFTADAYKPYVVDTLEFKVDAKYTIEGLTKN